MYMERDKKTNRFTEESHAAKLPKADFDVARIIESARSARKTIIRMEKDGYFGEARTA